MSGHGKSDTRAYGTGGSQPVPGSVEEVGAEFLVMERVVYVHPREPVAFYQALPQLRIHTAVSARSGAWPLSNAPLSAQRFGMLDGSELLGIWHVPGFSVGPWISLNIDRIWVPLQVKVEGASLFARWGTSVPSKPYLIRLPRQPSAEDAYNLGWRFEQEANYAAAEGWYRQAAGRRHTLAGILIGRLAYGRDRDEAFKWWLWADGQGDLRASNLLGYAFFEAGPHQDLQKALRWYRRAATSENAEVRAAGEEGVQSVEGLLNPPAGRPSAAAKRTAPKLQAPQDAAPATQRRAVGSYTARAEDRDVAGDRRREVALRLLAVLRDGAADG